jgi:hypothetical protein
MVKRVPSAISTPDQTRAAVDLAAQVQHEGETKMVDGGQAGPGAEWHKVSGKSGIAVYTIPHSLGIIPAFAELKACHTPGTPSNLTASPSSYDQWTTTEVKVRVDAVGIGGVAGAIMWFRVGGQR